MEKNFGQILEKLRIKKGLTLRQTCRLLKYDPSNWSKIERGKLPPPSNEKILKKWAKTLGILKEVEINEFVDKAQLAQGILPRDVLRQENIINFLPVFFRTVRNKKPTRKEINKLIKLIQKT